MWSWAFEYDVKTYATRLSTKCDFIAVLLMWPFYTIGCYKIKDCEISMCHGLTILAKHEHHPMHAMWDTM